MPLVCVVYRSALEAKTRLYEQMSRSDKISGTLIVSLLLF